MKKNQILALAAALALSASMISPTLAIDRRDMMGWNCQNTGARSTHCESDLVVRGNEAETYYNEVVLPLLKNAGYPSEILVDDPKDMAAIKKGWNVRRDCRTLPEGATTHDRRVNMAKVVYCIVKEKGFAIPKPNIVAGY